MAKSKLIKEKQRQRKAARSYEAARAKFNRMVEKYKAATRKAEETTGRQQKYYLKRAKELDKKLYHQRKALLTAGKKAAEARGDKQAAQVYEDALIKQQHVRRDPKLPRKDEFWHQTTKAGISKYDILERDHREEIHDIMKKLGMSYGEAQEVVWDNLVSAGEYVQSTKNGVWLHKISEDEYEVISPL